MKPATHGSCADPARSLHFGFTIVEFAVTLVLLAIGIALAIPSLQDLTANNQLTAANNSLVTGMNLARSTAITSGEDISICPSANAVACSDDSWESGWIVFNDVDGDAQADTDEVIRVVTLQGNLETSGFGESIEFRSDGTTSMGSDATITNCYADSSITSKCLNVVVSAFGMIQSGEYHGGGS